MKFLLKIYFVFIALIFIVSNVYAKDLKFVQLTDTHFSASGLEYANRGVVKSKSVLEKTVDDINSIANVDFVVFTGDNIDQADDEDLKAFLKIANRLKAPYYVVIGNHEVFRSQHFDKKDYMKVVRRYSKNCRPSGANYVFTKKGFVFLVVDGAKEIIPGPAGYYKKDTLRWLNKKLTHYKHENVIIFQHFPIEAPYYNRTHSTYNAEEYKDVINKHKNIIAIFSGHYHANAEKLVNGVYHVSTPALMEPPHNYKVVEIVGNDKKGYNVYTQLRRAE